MKKWIAALLAAAVLLGLGAAIAVGGSSEDPLISKSYLENTFLPNLASALQNRAAVGTKSAYEEAVGRLDALGEADLTAASAPGGESAYTPADLRMGSSLTLQPGSSMVLYQGAGSVSAGTLADVTDGSSLSAGGALVRSHRYIVTSSETALVEMTATGKVGYQGVGSVKEGGPVVLPFTDVTGTDWFRSSVAFVYERGYFRGTGANEFSPKFPMNRAMLATVLYRFSGDVMKATEPPFGDVVTNVWYSDGVAWAGAHKIVSGVGGGMFKPTGSINREQMVTMLYNYMTLYEKGNTSARGDLSQFPDQALISSWARDAVSWGVGTGLLTGRTTGEFDPKGIANRAEVAVLLERFVNLVEKG